MNPLPQATSLRFQPLRSGLLNLFKYQDQEFWYEKGRLLVRGNNGTGKSRVLALQLPFLFDGEISANRVEPDGDRARQIAWHLLMDDQYDNRTGYTWIEFGRRDPDGTAHYLTLGCGMKAVKGGDNQPSRWYFITSQRIGADLALLDGQTPRSAERLSEAMNEDSFFTKAARDYRGEVNRRLFGLSQSAYAALIELLIRLRAPQLSKKLDEKTLFEALSNALPPLAPEVVDQVATAFKQLDDLRQQYRHLSDLSNALSQFRTYYQSYVRTALLRRSDATTAANSRYESAQKNLNKLQQTIEAGEAQKAEAQLRIAEAENHSTACQSALDTLASRPEATQAADLDAAEKAAQEKQRHFSQAQHRANDSEGKLKRYTTERDEQSQAVDRAVRERIDLELSATHAAATTGFSVEHTEIIPGAESWPQEAKTLTQIRKKHDQLSEDHLYRLKQIETEQKKISESSQQLKQAQSKEIQAAEAVERIKDEVSQHHTAASNAVALLRSDYMIWQSPLKWLDMPVWSELAASFDDWLETDAPEHRVLSAAVATAVQMEITAYAQAQAALQTRQNELRAQMEALEVEETELAKSPASPLLPKVRAAAAQTRQNRPGAPLWQLCEFQPHLTPAECAGLEAALEAAGLLDAWISPNGQISLTSMPADTFLSLQEAWQPPPRNLAEVLKIDPQLPHREVPADVLQRALQQIGYGAASGLHWVNADGRWQLGPVSGRGEKANAEYLGQRSREAARSRRLSEIETERILLAKGQDQLALEADNLANRQAEAAAEAEKAPKDDSIASHLTLRTHARTRLHVETQHFDQAVQETARMRQAHSQREHEFSQLVHQLGYAAHRDRLHELRPSWEPYKLAMAHLWNKSEAVIQASEHLQQAASRLQQAAESHASESQLARLAETASIEATQAFETLRSIVGISVSDYQSMVATARQDKEFAVISCRTAEDAFHKIDKELAGVLGQVQPAQERISASENERELAIRELRRAFDAGLFSEADESLADIESNLWSPTRSVAIARLIAKNLPESEHTDEVWNQRLNLLDGRINELRNSVGAQCQIEREELPGSLILLNCKFQSSTHRPAECLLAVEREREQQDRLLNEEERKIIDRYLVTEVSLQLQQLMVDAQVRRDRINKEMEKCSTTLGVKMKLVWEPISEGIHPALTSVRSLLLMDHALWSDEQRTTVGAFLQQLITDERLRNPAAPAAEQLLHALDYRRWHVFAAERFQNGRWERLTRKRYGTGSGGEKALMLTIPQMAAASSHYSSAAAHAPRFILLDEAFAGMDKPTRSSCMGLLEAFDLDLMMTSEREQGAHATLSGIAIYHLVANAEAVAATRWVWNGSQSRLAPVPDTPELRVSFTLQA